MTTVSKLVSLLKYFWVLIPLAVHGAIAVLAVFGYCRFIPWSLTRATSHVAAASAMDAALAHVVGDLRPLLDAHRSAFAVADGLQLAGNRSSFSQVGPKLFLAFAMQPMVSEMTYAGIDGAAYSYYRGEDGLARALFTSPRGKWYTQAADPATGRLVGRPGAAARPEHLPNATQVLLDAKSGGRSCASLGAGLRFRPGARMLSFSAPVYDAGVVLAAVAVDDVLRGAAGFNVDVQIYYAIGDGEDGKGHTAPTVYRPLVGDGSIPDDDMEEVMGAFANVECTASAIDAPELELHSPMYGYKVACTNFDVSGVNLRLRLVTEVWDATTMFRRVGVAVICIVSSMVVVATVACFFMGRALRRAAAREAALDGELVRQKEAVQQAERKSMNKSNAFASAIHDIRSALAAIAGLVEVSRPDAQGNPTVTENLNQMDVCTKKLFDILNTILDTSKVESGKMQLEEVEFSMADVLEESVDMANAAAIGRGERGAVEVFWDPWDLTVLRCGTVVGDCKRFKQILDNLLGNAIKFTTEGHVVLRACCNLPIASRSSMVAPTSRFRGGGFLRRWLLRAREDRADQSSRGGGFLRRWLLRAREDRADQSSRGGAASLQNDPDSVEFYLEVSDTGVGIPKEKRESVFENYVQVKEGHGGTGLGLGIVQSFVRLMGGEISIMDKEPGEPGTCFRFNVLLKVSQRQQQQEEEEEGEEVGGDDVVDIEHGTAISSSKARDDDGDLRASLFREPGCFKGAHCVLLVHDDGTRRRILQGWMESVGMKVWLVQRAELIASTLEMVHSAGASPSRTPSASSSPPSLQPGGADCPGTDRCFRSKEMVSQVLPMSALRNGSGGSGGQQHYPPFVVIDVSGGILDDICKEVSSIAKAKRTAPCKVVCLADLRAFSEHSARLMAAGSDLVLRKPMHGSRLQALLRAMRDPGSANSAVAAMKDEAAAEVALPAPPPPPQGPETAAGDDKPLDGMRVLLVEDTLVLQTIQKKMLTLFGANVQIAKDGSMAVDMFRDALEHAGAVAEKEDHEVALPYDVVFMDCQMPVMDGYEATKLIREEEKRHGIRTPIIALTAHSMEEDLKEAIVAGMDLHLTKPIEKKRIVEVVHQICKQKN